MQKRLPYLQIDSFFFLCFSNFMKEQFTSGRRSNKTLWEKRIKKYGPMGGTKPPGRKLRCRIHFHCSMAKFVVHAAARPCARVSRSAMFSIQDGSTGVRIAGLVSRSAHASCLSCQEAGHWRIISTLVYSTPPP